MPVYTVHAMRMEQVSLDVEADSPGEAKEVLRNHGRWDEAGVLPTSLGGYSLEWVNEEDETVLDADGNEVG